VWHFCTTCRSEILAITSGLYPCQSPGEAADCCKVNSTHAPTLTSEVFNIWKTDDDDDDNKVGIIV